MSGLEWLDFRNFSLLDDVMRGLLLGWALWSVVGLPIAAGAVTPAPALTDREIAERLTRLETRLDEGLTGLREEMAQMRADMQEQNRQLREEVSQMRADMQEQNRQLRADMQEQGRQLRTDMNSRFEEQGRMLLGIVAAFTALVAVNIGLVVWDRRTSVRPLEDKVSGLAEEVSESRSQVSTLLEVLRALGQQNQTVAAVLKRFNLL